MPPIPAVSRKRQSIINLTFHYFAMLLVIVQGIVLAPLYLKYVSPELYGAWLATGNVLAWIALIDPGLSKVMQQRVAHTLGGGDHALLIRVIGTGLALGFVLSLIPLVAWLFSTEITGLIPKLSPDEQSELARAFQWALLSTALTIASYQPSACTVGLQMTTAAGLVYVAAGVLGIVATILALLAGWGLVALPLGLVIRAAIMLAAYMLLTLRWCRRHLLAAPRVSRDELGSYASLVSVTFLERLGTTLIQQLDAFLAAWLISPHHAAVYSFTGKALDPVRLSSERFGPAFLPGLAHLAGEGKTDRAVEVSRRLLSVVSYIASVGAACVVALNFAFLPLWLGASKGAVLFGGQPLTLLLAVSVVISVSVSTLCDVVFALGGIRVNAAVRLLEGVVKLALQIALALRFGVVGLAVGAGLASLLVTGVFMPAAAARLFGRRPAEQSRDLAATLLRSALTLAGGALLGWALRASGISWSWPGFLLAAMVAAVALGAWGLVAHTPVRQDAASVVRAVRARLFANGKAKE